jgi:hypothetical protein
MAELENASPHEAEKWMILPFLSPNLWEISFNRSLHTRLWLENYYVQNIIFVNFVILLITKSYSYDFYVVGPLLGFFFSR